ncbi:hypothetical protein QQF64_032267 [Cirrhinus molitorella]|uniref:Uncharacterized protein n=1 Tax=Cirrhinus molitorella TaxID=172907 RepID=A0ABR3MZC5_9TELE
MVEMCPTCQQFQPKNQKEPLISHEIPELPWLKVAADIFEIRGQSFLLIVDYMSKFPEVMNIRDKTARTVIEKMNKMKQCMQGMAFQQSWSAITYPSPATK